METNKIWHLFPYDSSLAVWHEYDIVWSMVVIAPTEEMARSAANNNGQQENKIEANVWLNPALTQCDMLGIANDNETPTCVLVTDRQTG